MPDSSWWTVNDALMRIIAGPYVWDGATPLSLPAGQRAVNTNPVALGYATAAAGADMAALMTAMDARLTTVEARLVAEARGIKATPALAIGETLTVRVTLKTAMRNATGATTTNYTATALLIQRPSITSMRITAEPTIVDAQNVDVPVTSTLGVALGAANVLVFADAK